MSPSDIKNISAEVASDDLKINHGFGVGYTLKIIQIDPAKDEKILLEIETTAGRMVTLNANIEDREDL